MEMKNYIFWDMTPCSPFKVNRFSEEYIAFIILVKEQAKQETGMTETKNRTPFETLVDFSKI
jgi:hypothetical protein